MNAHLRLVAWTSAALLLLAAPAWAQLTADQQAEMVLATARKAYQEKNYSQAAARFREFTERFAKHKDANAARYGQALALLALPVKDRNEADLQALLARLAGEASFEDQASAALQLGLLLRAQGLRELARAEAAPDEAGQRTANAKTKFEQAAAAYTAALPLLQAAAGDAGTGELSEAWERAARARCDLAEMQFRLGKLKEAQTQAEVFLTDKDFARSRIKGFGRFLAAHAAFLLGDLPAAQKTLTMALPHSAPDYGPLARYLLARTHHLAEERGDALAHYEGAIADHQKHLSHAATMLKEPQRFNNDPVKRAEFEELVRRPTPDHIARANLYLGVLLYEAGRFAEAKARFQEFVKAAPKSPLRPEADLRIGFCQVQLKEYSDALKTLQPLTDREGIADQVYFWIGKAQLGLAPDPVAKWSEHRAQAAIALNTMRAAFERAGRLGDSPETRARRGEILLEIADAHHALKEAKPAADTYQAILNSKLLPEREEEISLRLIQALHAAGDFGESDARCKAFFQKFAGSTLAGPVAFVYAENAVFRAAQVEKAPPSAERSKQLQDLQGEALTRLQQVVEKHPDHPKILLARHSIGLVHYRRRDFVQAQKSWNAIPQPERNGELAHVPYLLADCILRQTPATLAEDADGLAAGKVEEQLRTAADLLDAFISGNPKDASVADALLKYGLCQQRRAAGLADPKEKQAILAGARAAYERLGKEFSSSPLVPNAVFERAKVIVQQGDVNNGMNELRRFAQDPLRQAPIAPMAMINLATLLRGANKAPEAADLLQKSREAHEQALSQDPARVQWIALLRFHHGVALREANKLPEARTLFEAVAKQAPKTQEGMESSLRFGQALKEEGQQRVERGRKMTANPNEAPQAQQTIGEGYNLIRQGAAYLEAAADQLKEVDTAADVRARMLYDAAWGWRLLVEPELREAKLAQAKELSSKPAANGVKTLVFEVPLSQIALLPSEKKARAAYKKLIDQVGDAGLGVEARLELAEMLVQREELDQAFSLLNEALDREPNADLTEKIRLHLGAVQAAKGNVKVALAQFEAVAQNPKSQNLGWAYFRAGDALLEAKDFGAAIQRLAPFRDQQAFQNIPGLSDRALLRLAQAYARAQAPGESVQAYQRLIGAFPNSPWIDDARFGLAYALQQQGSLEEAGALYRQVVERTASELAARAQLQIGAIRMAQKRFHEAALAFLVVPATYGYAEQSAVALLRCADAYREANMREPMVAALERLVREYPNSEFAAEAKERLGKK